MDVLKSWRFGDGETPPDTSGAFVLPDSLARNF
jgi:hypothetical protein